MLIEMSTKERFESFLRPFALRVPISPNALTLSAIVVMAVAAWAVVQAVYWAAAVLIILSGFIDMLDGTVAKSQNRASAFGALLDRVGDRIADALIFGSIILAGLVQLWLGLAVLVLVMLGSYASACLEAATKTKVGEKLSMRAIRLVILAAALLLAYIVQVPQYFDYVFAIVLVLSLYAFAQRMFAARKILKPE